MTMVQRALNEHELPHEGMPRTRYQGSKRKLLPWLYQLLRDLEFESCIDLFGGTGSVTHLLRFMNKKVIYNDILPSNAAIARALFADGEIRLSEDGAVGVLEPKKARSYKTHIADVYGGIYFTDEENQELDCACQNIADIDDPLERSEAYYCLFQACLAKRPYNLFHRANLKMRTRDVERSFGNKATWERPFAAHIRRFHRELRAYRMRRARWPTEIMNEDAFDLDCEVDLAYIDTPYAKSQGVQETNYFNFYHFLDACIAYEDIPRQALLEYNHRPIYPPTKLWHGFDDFEEAFASLFEGLRARIVVVSYRSDGVPGPEVIAELMKRRWTQVSIRVSEAYKYVLTARGMDNREVAIVGER